MDVQTGFVETSSNDIVNPGVESVYDTPRCICHMNIEEIVIAHVDGILKTS